ncbi:hypothetical protein K466DRAFT_400714 [Polyporus arcularius HHB13444]|uniref:Uncharacterized protein n=1 Tax=Polyporus arcularius HHB13444 TaxID=1314778 RepID=A0A5C3PMK5_9APHY|nr:hypothetical protein K466DRAFT_400714 [Polyporus arcularius HHB13444]
MSKGRRKSKTARGRQIGLSEPAGAPSTPSPEPQAKDSLASAGPETIQAATLIQEACSAHASSFSNGGLGRPSQAQSRQGPELPRHIPPTTLYLLPRIRSNSLYSERVRSHAAARSSATPLILQGLQEHCSRSPLARTGLYEANSMAISGSSLQRTEAVLYETDPACRTRKPWVRHAPSAGLVFACIYGGGPNSCIQVICNGTSSCTAKACKI